MRSPARGSVCTQNDDDREAERLCGGERRRERWGRRLLNERNQPEAWPESTLQVGNVMSLSFRLLSKRPQYCARGDCQR